MYGENSLLSRAAGGADSEAAGESLFEAAVRATFLPTALPSPGPSYLTLLR